jgi:branched-chain amino acid aminotransferase
MTVNVWKLVYRPGQTELLPVSLPDWVSTLNDASSLLPGGAYTTLRTYEGRKALMLTSHFKRLEETARLAGKPVDLDEKMLLTAMRQLTHVLPPGADLRFRLTVDLNERPGEVYLATEPLTTPPPAAYTLGVWVITCDLQRQLPEAKLTRFIARASPVRKSLPADANEAIMVSPEGCLLEGLTSNFFAVLENELRTAETGVLKGITRSLVLDAARQLELPLRMAPVCLPELDRIDEAFITSSSRGVLPVVQIDQTVVGRGRPGEITGKITRVFQNKVQTLLESI